MNTLQFPFLDLGPQHEALRAEITAAVNRVLQSQHFILGPEVEQFEREFERLAGCRHAIGCASGSDALLLALMALEVGPGDEVITTPFTFVATAGCIARLGARPVFVDIDPVTYNLDPRQVERAITRRTRTIMPVHLFGLPAEMSAILEIAARHKVGVVEDAAQAIGARYRGQAAGTMGAIGCFSFFPSKNLGGAGDGGMLTTGDAALADRLRTLRTHGGKKKYEYELIGMNSRLDALQAAILRAKLTRLDEWTAARQRNAARYISLFAEYGLAETITLPSVPAGSEHVFNQFVIRVENRDGLKEHLRSSGIPTEVYYPSPLHLQRAFLHFGYRAGDFPEAEAACRQVLALPVYPEIGAARQEAVVKEIAAYCSAETEGARYEQSHA